MASSNALSLAEEDGQVFLENLWSTYFAVIYSFRTALKHSKTVRAKNFYFPRVDKDLHFSDKQFSLRRVILIKILLFNIQTNQILNQVIPKETEWRSRCMFTSTCRGCIAGDKRAHRSQHLSFPPWAIGWEICYLLHLQTQTHVSIEWHWKIQYVKTMLKTNERFLELHRKDFGHVTWLRILRCTKPEVQKGGP